MSLTLTQHSWQAPLARSQVENLRDVPDPDTSIRYPVKFRHPALSGINLPDIYRIKL